MFGGLFSLIGLSWGNGSMSVDGPSEPPSFPAAGTILHTLTDEVYPIAEGGSYFYFNSNQYPNQQADVYEKADGFGGSYIDWENAFNIEFIPQYTSGFTNYDSTNDYGAIEVPYGSNNYYSAQYTRSTYTHDGNGSYEYSGETSPENKPSYSYITYAYDETFEVPDLFYVYGSNYIISSGRYYNYEWTGDGSTYQVSSVQGFYFPYGQSFYSTSNYTNVNGTDYQNGTGTDYVHNGLGSYTTLGTGNYYPSGWLIYEDYYYGTQYPVEVPSGSLYYYDSQRYGQAYVWDGTGGYTNVSSWYIPYGTYIGYYDGYDYYWDGIGGYFTG